VGSIWICRENDLADFGWEFSVGSISFIGICRDIDLADFGGPVFSAVGSISLNSFIEIVPDFASPVFSVVGSISLKFDILDTDLPLFDIEIVVSSVSLLKSPNCLDTDLPLLDIESPVDSKSLKFGNCREILLPLLEIERAREEVGGRTG